MTESLQQLILWVGDHPFLAYVTVFLVAMVESLAVVGLLVPGVVMMFGVGALISAGALAFWPVCLWAVAGAVVGDGLSYWLGYHYSDRLRGAWPFNRHPHSLDRGVEFFQKYGGKSVVFGRFVGPVRAVIPLVAGMLGMSPARFLAANVLSALAWAPAYLLPGMVFGASMELASEVAFRLVVMVVLLLILIFLAIWLVKRVFRLLHPHARGLVQGLLQWSELHPSAGRIAASLADPAHPDAKALAVFATLLMLTTLAFGLVFGAVVTGTFVDGINPAVLDALQSLRTPWADHLLVHFSRLADANVILPVALAILAFLIFQRHWRTAGYWLAALAFAFLASTALKYVLQIPRPDLGLASLTPWAFPSSHVSRATVIYGFFAVMIARGLTVQWRWIAYSLASLFIIAVSLARLYLGAHWFTDVIGSLALGLAWVSGLSIAYVQHTQVEAHWRRLAGIASLVLVTAFSYQSWYRHSIDVDTYRPKIVQQRIETASWWQTDWQQLPRYRKDLRGHQDHPLNLQYAGAAEAFVAALTNKGWQRADMLSGHNMIKLLSPSTPLSELPVLPQVHDGHHEAITLTRMLSEQRRLVARLWRTGFTLGTEETMLWLGNVTWQNKTVILSFFTIPTSATNAEEALSILLSDLQQTDLTQRSAAPSVILLRESGSSLTAE